MPPPRLLVLDDDPEILSLVSDILKREAFSVVTADRPQEALAALAEAGPFDLVISDVNLPEMDGFAFRTAAQKVAGAAKIPFVFLSAADEAAELAIARGLHGNALLLKPISRLDLLRVVEIALGRVRSDRGPIPVALDRVLADVAANRETGILTALAGTTVKRVVFRDGAVVFAGSNDPREVIGQVFVRSGLISERDLVEAFTHRESAGVGAAAPLGVVLTALRKVTPEQCQKVFEKKIREAVLDLFLWKGGLIEYAAGGVENADAPFPLSLALPALRVDGLKRRIKWAEVRRLIPDPSVKFARPGNRWPKGFPRTEGDKMLAQHIEAGRSMAEILVELRGQDFAVGSRLVDLLKIDAIHTRESTGFAGALVFDSVTIDIDDELAALDAQEAEAGYPTDTGEDVDAGAGADSNADTAAGQPTSTRILTSPLPQTAAPAPARVPVPMAAPAPFEYAPTSFASLRAPAPAPVSDPIPSAQQSEMVQTLTRALVLFRAGDLLGARENLVEVLHLDPANPLARQRLREVDDALAKQAASQGVLPDAVIFLAIPLEKLVGTAIPPNDAFVLTRLAGGALTVADLIRICPLPPNEVLQVVQRYLESNVLARK